MLSSFARMPYFTLELFLGSKIPLMLTSIVTHVHLVTNNSQSD